MLAWIGCPVTQGRCSRDSGEGQDGANRGEVNRGKFIRGKVEGQILRNAEP